MTQWVKGSVRMIGPNTIMGLVLVAFAINVLLDRPDAAAATLVHGGLWLFARWIYT